MKEHALKRLDADDLSRDLFEPTHPGTECPAAYGTRHSFSKAVVKSLDAKKTPKLPKEMNVRPSA